MKKLDILSPQESGTPKRGPLAENWKNSIAWVLMFWDSLKEKWKKAKQNFWWKQGREQFVQNLIAYNQWRAEWLEQNAGELEAIGYADFSPDAQQKFEEEFLRDLILYQQCASPIEREELTRDDDVETEEVDSLAKRNLKPGEILDLEWENIGDEWAKALAQMELKPGVTFNLEGNNIGDEWAKALAQMKLKEGVTINLEENNIGNEWVKALAQMELKEGVTIKLPKNKIWSEGKAILKKWQDDARARGVNCRVYR